MKNKQRFNIILNALISVLFLAACLLLIIFNVNWILSPPLGSHSQWVLLGLIDVMILILFRTAIKDMLR